MSDGGKGDKRRPMQVSDRIYQKRYELAFGKAKGRKKSCNGCTYQTMDINPTCAKCNDRDLYSKSIGSIFGDDINVGESS